jgi:hypothetical protein
MGRVLRKDDFKRAIESLHKIEIPEIRDESGEPGVIYMRKASAAALMPLAELHASRQEGAPINIREINELQNGLLVELLRDDAGERIFEDGDVETLNDFFPADVYQRLAGELTGQMTGREEAAGGGEQADPFVAEVGGGSPSS